MWYSLWLMANHEHLKYSWHAYELSQLCVINTQNSGVEGTLGTTAQFKEVFLGSQPQGLAADILDVPSHHVVLTGGHTHFTWVCQCCYAQSSGIWKSVGLYQRCTCINIS